MSIIQATVPKANLATAIGDPNVLEVDYSTNILLPVAGPFLFFRIIQDFVRGLMALNQFLVFCESTTCFLDTGKSLNLDFKKLRSAEGLLSGGFRYDRTIGRAAENALPSRSILASVGVGTGAVRPPKIDNYEADTEATALLSYLASPNMVFREAFESGLMEENNQIFSAEFRRAKDFKERCKMVLNVLLSSRKDVILTGIKPVVREITEETMKIAKARYRSFLFDEFSSLPQQVKDLLIQWLVAFHRSYKRSVGIVHKELKPTLGFTPTLTSREWAFNRKERLQMEFGTPDLVGPVGAEALTPQGSFKREDYRATQDELTMLAAESIRVTAREARGLAIGTLRNQLDTIYYAGPGNVNQLTSQASTSLMREERRDKILSLIREVSESRENVTISVGVDNISTTISRESKGVDNKLASTHHRFKVVVPIKTTVYLNDVGLTWCPRIFNPFLGLRQAARDAYDTAYTEFMRQYYVPEPIKPHIVWERYNVTKDVNMEGEEAVSETFMIQLASIERETKPDLNGATVVWNQDYDWFNDDPDTWSIWLSNLSFIGHKISGRVTAETTDGGADFQGYARITVPIMRYSQETVNSLAQHEADLSDYNLKLQALEAQAHQYARIKQREFIERHQRDDSISKTVFEELVKRICLTVPAQNLSYYKEIISRCIDWSRAKIEFESRAVDSLLYADFPPDHVMNSPAVRFFLPVIKSAEEILFDVLIECGSFFTRASVESARNKIDDMRNSLESGGPTELDKFESSLVIGEHVEGVMSNHDLSK
jgi:hypothetical protein